MDKLPALYFPETIIDPQITARLLIFFETVHYYRPTEASDQPGEAHSPLSRLLGDKGLCQGITPAPLGSDIDRFNRLIRDLQYRRDDYGDRLAFLSLAATLPVFAADKEEASTGSLTTAIFKASGIQKNDGEKKEERNRMELWQARIILKLAEILDQEEKEIATALGRITTRQRNLLAALKGPGDIAGKLIDDISWPASRHDAHPRSQPIMTAQRMKAWTQLFLAEQKELKPTARCWLLTTSQPETAAMINDAYETLFKKPAAAIYSVPLPVLHDYRSASETTELLAAESYLKDRTAFRTNAMAPLSFFINTLKEIAAGKKDCPPDGIPTDPAGRQNAAAWSAALRQTFPTSNPARCRLSFYCLRDISLTELLRQTCRLAAIEQPSAAAYPHGIMALLEQV